MRLRAKQNVVLPGFGRLEEGDEFDGGKQLIELHPHYVEAVDPELVEAKREGETLTRSEVINALGDAEWVHSLIDAGFSTLQALSEASDEDLVAVDGVGPARVREIRELEGDSFAGSLDEVLNG